MGFWRYGEWHKRPRSAMEKKWMAGGQGKTRQEKRAARIDQWSRGEWLPAWLRQYQADRDRRLGQDHVQSSSRASSSREPHWQPSPPPAQDPDEGGDDQVNLLQGRLDRSKQVVDTSGDVEESSFMERPGLQGREVNYLYDRGIPGELVQRFEALMRRYEHYQANDQGPEARWALGRWLLRSQSGADVQDDAEEPIRRRAQDPCVYPLRREPTTDALRDELCQWVDTLTELMAEIWVEGVRAANPGTLREIPRATEPASSSSGNRGRTRSPRTRSPRRPTPRQDNSGPEADETTLMEYGGYGTGEEADEAGEDRGEDGGEVTTPEADIGAGVGPIAPMIEDTGEVPEMLGPADASALDPPADRMAEHMEAENEFADQAYMVEAAVRRAMVEPNAGTSREVVRRLLLCSHHLTEVQFWLQRALQQALQTCPPGDTEVNWRQAVDYEGVIWQRIIGMSADERMVRRLREVVEQRLARRARNLEELEHRLEAGGRGSGRSTPYGQGRFPSVATRNNPPWRRHGGDSGVIRPSFAPELRPRATPERPSLPLGARGRRRTLGGLGRREGDAGEAAADTEDPGAAVGPTPAMASMDAPGSVMGSASVMAPVEMSLDGEAEEDSPDVLVHMDVVDPAVHPVLPAAVLTEAAAVPASSDPNAAPGDPGVLLLVPPEDSAAPAPGDHDGAAAEHGDPDGVVEHDGFASVGESGVPDDVGDREL